MKSPVSGINPKFLSLWKKKSAIGPEITADQEQTWVLPIFNNYVTAGDIGNSKVQSGLIAKWEPVELRVAFEKEAHVLMFRVGQKAINENVLDVKMIANAFYANYISQLQDIYWHVQFKRICADRKHKQFGHECVFFSALGLLLGDDRALDLARLQCEMHIKDFYSVGMCTQAPAASFILRLYFDYFKLPEPLPAASPDYPELSALFADWRTDDLDLLVSLCIAVCHRHTYQIKFGEDGEHEFSGYDWMRYPIEIMAVLKLRAMLGLPNPERIDHLLMDSPLGVLPTETAECTDPLMLAVVARMREDGFDVDQIRTALYQYSEA